MSRFGLVALFGFGVAACSTAPQGPYAVAPVRGATVAFESIDGPPDSIFRKLVQDLGEEAVARQVAIVSREAPAQFRVRGYLATIVEGRRHTTVIDWVWDVYDAEQHRVLRIRGEEPASSGGGTWAAADDRVLRQIATNGMGQLAAFLAAPGSEAIPQGRPDERAPNAATSRDRMTETDVPAFAYAGGAH